MTSEPTFAEDIEQVADGEKITKVVIGAFGWSSSLDEEDAYAADRIGKRTKPIRGKVLTWEKARPMLDYEYDRSYGAPECDAIWAWTKTQVIFVGTYDGSTYVTAVPRNPIDGVPGMTGGG